MSLETNKALARRYFEEFINRGDLSVADEILDPNVAYRSPVVSLDGIDRMKMFFLMVRKNFPDLHYVVEPAIAEGDRVVNCFSSSGTFRGEVAGTQFSGRQFSVPGVMIFRIQKDKIVEVHCFWDAYTQMQQLNWIPMPAKNCA